METAEIYDYDDDPSDTLCTSTEISILDNSNYRITLRDKTQQMDS